MKVLVYEDLKPDKGVPYSRAQLLRLEKRGLFPERIPLGPNRHGWTEHEIDEWIKSRVRARDEECV
jgi:prophage regulatory protein